ncbi:MAG TPA: XdhC family protein [Acidiferrobacterales bacterium]
MTIASADEEVLRAARDWLAAGRAVWLFAVAQTWGSSPRPPGALMVASEAGELRGSVSGGCVEADILERVAHGRLTVAEPEILRYGVTRDDAERFGLPCGGHLEIVVERLDAGEPLERLLEAVGTRRLVARRLCLATGEVSLHRLSAPQPFRYDGRDLVRPFGPGFRLLIIGAGQASRLLAEMALALDYQVIVCDPREEYARAWQVERATLDTRMPDDAVRALATDAVSAVVALTHDPRLDDLALLEALNADTFYVGALGSRANNAKRRARLTALGIAPERVARLHGPVGLPIGSRTPAEIAVAVLAELTALRHGIQLARRGQRVGDADAAPTPRLETA